MSEKTFFEEEKDLVKIDFEGTAILDFIAHDNNYNKLPVIKIQEKETFEFIDTFCPKYFYGNKVVYKIESLMFRLEFNEIF